jgi:hypothetical protein
MSQGLCPAGWGKIRIRTLGLEELELAVEKLEVRLREDYFRDIVYTRRAAHVSRLGGGISRVDNDLRIRGITDGHLGRHFRTCSVCGRKVEQCNASIDQRLGAVNGTNDTTWEAQESLRM